MGKTSKWFCACFGNHAQERSDGHPTSTSAGHVDDDDSDQNKHAIAVAVATAAVAEAAVAAAQAAAAVVRLTSGSGRCGGGSNSSMAHVSMSNRCRVIGIREEWFVAAVKIQSAFRGYLAKRALRALKGLVKLQALARGHIVRKRTEDAWRHMQTLLRAQSRVCAERALVSESPHSSTKSSQFHNLGPATPEKSEHIIRAKSTRHKQKSMLKRNVSKSKSNRTSPIDDEKSAKILEIDPHFTSKRRNLFHSSHPHHPHHQTLTYDQNSYYSCTTSKDSTTCQTVPSQSSCCEVQSLGPFTPTKSDGLKSYFNPSYMAYTESSKAKSRRSLSAPKQRPKIERSRSANRYLRSSEQKVSALQANFVARDYPGSGQLDRFGVPVRVVI